VPFLQQLGRDHRKFGTIGEHYPAVGNSLIATLAHFSGPTWTRDLADDCRSPAADVVVLHTFSAAWRSQLRTLFQNLGEQIEQ